MYAAKLCLSVIHGIGAGSKRKVYNVYTVYLLNILVRLAEFYIFGDKFGRAEKHTLEIRVLAVVLDFYDEKMSTVVLCKNIHTIILVVLALLIAFALKKASDADVLSEQGSNKPLKNSEIGLVSEKALHSPVKSDVVAHKPAIVFLLIKEFQRQR